MVLISNSNFTANTHKERVIHLLVYSADFILVLVNMKFERNFDSIAGGVVLSLNSNENIKIIIRSSRLNFTNNQFIGDGGGINILGTFQENCEIYIKDSYFNNNFGFSYGSVIHSSLTSANNKPYFVFIENCIFTHNKGKSIVYIGMEHLLFTSISSFKWRVQ